MDIGYDVRVCGDVEVLSGAAAHAAEARPSQLGYWCLLESDARLLCTCRDKNTPRSNL